jgi:hypothetical protein
MQTQVWAAILSLSGVVLGGGLSFLVQSTVQRRVERNDVRRQAVERAERAAEDRNDTPSGRRRRWTCSTSCGCASG